MLTTAHTLAPQSFKTALLAALNLALSIMNAHRERKKRKPLTSYAQLATECEALAQKDLRKKLQRILRSPYDDDRIATADALSDVIEYILRPLFKDDFPGECERLWQFYVMFHRERLEFTIGEGMVEALITRTGKRNSWNSHELIIAIHELLNEPSKNTIAECAAGLIAELTIRRSDLGLGEWEPFYDVMSELRYLAIASACARNDYRGLLELHSRSQVAHLVPLMLTREGNFATGRMLNLARDSASPEEIYASYSEIWSALKKCIERKIADFAAPWRYFASSQTLMRTFLLGIGGNNSGCVTIPAGFEDLWNPTSLSCLVRENMSAGVHAIQLQELFYSARGIEPTPLAKLANSRLLCQLVFDLDWILAAHIPFPEESVGDLLEEWSEKLGETVTMELRGLEFARWPDQCVSCMLALAIVYLRQKKTREAGACLVGIQRIVEVMPLSIEARSGIWANWYMITGRYFRAAGLSDETALMRASQVYKAIGNERMRKETERQMYIAGFSGNEGLRDKGVEATTNILRKFVRENEPPCLSK
ncbi:MAG: hypothetical protein H6876_06285 [Hyphomicrobiaceae bacterium]|nr:hypothetical protein [Hyphomicrobiaceae bacterium]